MTFFSMFKTPNPHNFNQIKYQTNGTFCQFLLMKKLVMQKSIIYALFAFFVFTACQNNTSNTSQKEKISAVKMKQKDTQAINDILKK